MAHQPPTFPFRGLVCIALLGTYALLFPLLYHLLGGGAAALAVIPVAIIGWLSGVAGGTGSGLLVMLINILLLTLVGQNGLTIMMAGSGGPGSLAIIIVGAFVGWLHTLFVRVRQQAATLVHEREHLEREINERQQAEVALHLYQRVLAATSHGVVVIDPHQPTYPILYCNPAFEQLTGYAPGDLVGQSFDLLFGAETDRRARARLRDAVVRGGECDLVVKHYRRGIVPFWNQVTVLPVRNVQGDVTHMIMLAVDVTQHYEVEQVLRESEQRLLLHVQQTPLAYIEWDLEFRVREWNPAAERIFGYPRNEALGRSGMVLVPDATHAEVDTVWRALLHHKGGGRNVNANVTRDGRLITCEWYNTPLVDEQQDIVGVVSLVHDITERVTAEAQLVQAALYDSLTDLPNRMLLMERINRALGRIRRHAHTRLAVLFLDLDRFKLINDSLGHPAGDQLLVEVARRLEQCVRDTDTVARLSGDEFAVLLDTVDALGDATVVAERMLVMLTDAFVLDGHSVTISASIGIAIGDAAEHTAESLLRDADLAMYRAKGLGKARYAVFDVSMYHAAAAALQLQSDLRRALAQDELVVYYQPIMSLDSGRIESCEALVRWNHPDRGLLLPGAFVPAAEENGLIQAIGDWVLREACRQAQAWCQEGFPLRVAVNLAAQQLQRPDLEALVGLVLDESGLDAEYLTIELTESSLLDRTAMTLDMMERLRLRGVSFAIDDFGTGYSSLSYVHRFPVSTLKIDRSFIQQLPNNQHDAVLTTTIINMAHTLQVRIVAEGVETEAQRAYLHTAGCDAVQGYLISRPVPPAEIIPLLQKHGHTTLQNANLPC